MALHRRFVLQRFIDVSGISGTGTVAEGVQFTNGVCVLEWTSTHPTAEFHADIDSVEAIHGHSGTTKVEWIDG